jgi:hypothetical protein
MQRSKDVQFEEKPCTTGENKWVIQKETVTVINKKRRILDTSTFVVRKFHVCVTFG